MTTATNRDQDPNIALLEKATGLSWGYSDEHHYYYYVCTELLKQKPIEEALKNSEIQYKTIESRNPVITLPQASIQQVQNCVNTNHKDLKNKITCNLLTYVFGGKWQYDADTQKFTTQGGHYDSATIAMTQALEARAIKCIPLDNNVFELDAYAINQIYALKNDELESLKADGNRDTIKDRQDKVATLKQWLGGEWHHDSVSGRYIRALLFEKDSAISKERAQAQLLTLENTLNKEHISFFNAANARTLHVDYTSPSSIGVQVEAEFVERLQAHVSTGEKRATFKSSAQAAYNEATNPFLGKLLGTGVNGWGYQTSADGNGEFVVELPPCAGETRESHLRLIDAFRAVGGKLEPLTDPANPQPGDKAVIKCNLIKLSEAIVARSYTLPDKELSRITGIAHRGITPTSRTPG